MGPLGAPFKLGPLLTRAPQDELATQTNRKCGPESAAGRPPKARPAPGRLRPEAIIAKNTVAKQRNYPGG